ncbi:WD40 repeat-like protein, partial [Aulographum hederae CBS 113979]
SASASPDRFIPTRSPQAMRDSFQLSKAPQHLNPEERVTRTRSAIPDPFSRRIRGRAGGHDHLRGTRGTLPPLAARGIGRGSSGLLSIRQPSLATAPRQASNGAVWNLGGAVALSDSVAAVSDGRGGLIGSGTTAPLYTSMFLNRPDPLMETEAHERRLALAFDVDQASRVLGISTSPTVASLPSSSHSNSPTRIWRDNEWIKEGSVALLDAPSLRDDYYCSLLAYSYTSKCLAVGLGSHVYLWSETRGVDTPDSVNFPSTSHVTSLAFSSTAGGSAILAVGRADGRVTLWSSFDDDLRFNAKQPQPVSCVCFRPNTVKRPSVRDRNLLVPTEELLTGDEAGNIYFYAVEWPSNDQRDLFAWHGAVTLLAKISAHTQQICGLAWSPDGDFFASGGNDNTCLLFESKRVFPTSNPPQQQPRAGLTYILGPQPLHLIPATIPSSVPTLPPSTARHTFTLAAAIKAIAFAPWQRGLLALGGGSNDRCIHFYHSLSGAALATIDCCAQVTSLVWSNTRREIAATFGFAQPEHPYRIAVFSWPGCEQVVGIPWFDEHRALYGIGYPGGPNDGGNGRRDQEGDGGGEGGTWWTRTREEGCLVVATSDASIKFHEVWAERKRATGGAYGLLGGSDILEGLHGVDKEADAVIR